MASRSFDIACTYTSPQPTHTPHPPPTHTHNAPQMLPAWGTLEPAAAEP